MLTCSNTDKKSVFSYLSKSLVATPRNILLALDHTMRSLKHKFQLCVPWIFQGSCSQIPSLGSAAFPHLLKQGWSCHWFSQASVRSGGGFTHRNVLVKAGEGKEKCPPVFLCFLQGCHVLNFLFWEMKNCWLCNVSDVPNQGGKRNFMPPDQKKHRIPLLKLRFV